MSSDQRNTSISDRDALRDDFATWNTCLECGTEWEDDEPTPGLLHRTRCCERCTEIALAVSRAEEK